ncbi:MAG: hypothetical protein K9G41_11455 [Flavobacteriales bacterium]|nr:hypothetical protein [Flavobacteriales bacterium]
MDRGTIEFNDNLMTHVFTNELGWLHSRNLDIDDHIPDFVLDRADDPRTLIFTVSNAYLTDKELAIAKQFLDNFSSQQPDTREFEIILLCGKLLMPLPKLPNGIQVVNMAADCIDAGIEHFTLN